MAREGLPHRATRASLQRSRPRLSLLLIALQVIGATQAPAQYNPRQERRTNAQRIAPSDRARQACRLFTRGERVDDREMRAWRADPACKAQVREYDRSRGRSIGTVQRTARPSP